jgi:outer membrane protein OmpA-like peptidoglycan-associated protein
MEGSMTNPIRFCLTAAILLAPIMVPVVAAAQPSGIDAPELEPTTIDRFSLILYAFDSDEPGPLNQRILDEYVVPEISKRSEISIVGYSDVVGQEVHNIDLARRRARKVATGIMKSAGAGAYASMSASAVGEEQAPYRYDLPEGRLLSRTVIITVKTKGESRGWEEREEGEGMRDE